MNDEPDAAILEAFDNLHHDTARGLFHRARSALGGNPSEADDLVQLVFEAAWLIRDRLFQRDLGGQRAWVYAVLNRKIVDKFRKTNHLVPASAKVQDLLDRKRSHRSTLRSAVYADLLLRALKVIAAMPPKRKTVFYFRAQEYKPSEIAEILGITPQAVTYHLNAGMEQLTAELGPVRELFEDNDENGGRE